MSPSTISHSFLLPPRCHSCRVPPDCRSDLFVLWQVTGGVVKGDNGEVGSRVHDRPRRRQWNSRSEMIKGFKQWLDTWKQDKILYFPPMGLSTSFLFFAFSVLEFQWFFFRRVIKWIRILTFKPYSLQTILHHLKSKRSRSDWKYRSDESRRFPAKSVLSPSAQLSAAVNWTRRSLVLSKWAISSLSSFSLRSTLTCDKFVKEVVWSMTKLTVQSSSSHQTASQSRLL